MGFRPRPGPGGTRCTGAERLPAIQTLGRVMPPSSHAWQPCQVCQFSELAKYYQLQQVLRDADACAVAVIAAW